MTDETTLLRCRDCGAEMSGKDAGMHEIIANAVYYGYKLRENRATQFKPAWKALVKAYAEHQGLTKAQAEKVLFEIVGAFGPYKEGPSS